MSVTERRGGIEGCSRDFGVGGAVFLGIRKKLEVVV